MLLMLRCQLEDKQARLQKNQVRCWHDGIRHTHVMNSLQLPALI